MSDRRISEAASEKRRGRPPAFDPAYESRLGKLLPTDGLSRRARLDALRVVDALHAIRGRHPWLWNPAPAHGVPIPAGQVGFRVGVLAELGRLGSPEAIREAAGWLEQVGGYMVPTKEAVRLLRARRLGRLPEATVEGLAEQLTRVVGSYLATHEAEAPGGLVSEALQVVLERFGD